jgi:hypothetical protein
MNLGKNPIPKSGRPGDFEGLLHLLDGELRLITPADPNRPQDEAPAPPPAGAPHYQLTHDYLVPSLRDWLGRKQRETMRGRAELRLQGLADRWQAAPTKRQLPAWWEWLTIRLLTRPKDWSAPQREMMGRADRYHAVRALVAAVLLVLLGWGTYEAHGRLQARALRDRLLDADTNEVPAIVREMRPCRRWLTPLLRDAYARAEAGQGPRKQLHASLALLPVDATQAEYLYRRLLDAEPHEASVIRDALAPHQSGLEGRLWAVVERPEPGKGHQRLRAGQPIQPTHAARQAPNGTWTSKLGRAPLIRHLTPEAVNCTGADGYGRPVAVYVRTARRPGSVA